MKTTWPGAVARRVGLSGAIEFTPSRVGLTLHVPCKKGDHTVDVEVEPGLHPDFIAKRMLAKGWTFGSKLACPACARKKPSPPKDTSMKQAVAAVKPSEIVPSDAARAARREAHDRIAVYFDIANGTYTDGYSDERIADETGASLAWVKQRREEEFGPLKEPGELVAMRDELAQLRRDIGTMQSNYQRRVDELANRFAALCKSNGWALPV